MRLAFACLTLVSLTSCFTSVPDVRAASVEGKYTVFVRPGENGCNLSAFQSAPDPKAPNGQVELSLYQAAGSAQVSGRAEGWLKLLFLFWLGSDEIKGRVDGDALDLQAFTPKSQQEGACVYTMGLRMTATVRGTMLVDGVVHYQPQMTSTSPDCKPLEGCETTQLFTATRTAPPTPLDGGL